MQGCKICGKRENTKRCGKCKSVRYCGNICQKIDFFSHVDLCHYSTETEIPLNEDKKDPDHPCPVCYEEEDSEGVCGMCLECGTLFCGMCNVKSKLGKGNSCPMCRNTMDFSLEEKIIKTKKFIEKADEHKLKPLYTNLGVMYAQSGEMEKGKEYIQKAVDLGYPMAYYNMGVILELDGKMEESLKYHRMAAAYRNRYSQEKLASIEWGNTELCKHWYLRSAENGGDKSMYNMGVLTEKDGKKSEAKEWYIKSYENGFYEAIINLGLMCEEEGDYISAGFYYGEAITYNVLNGFYHLGKMFETEIDDLETAKKWYSLGMENGERKCIFVLADINEKEENYAIACELYQKSSKLGCPISPGRLGLFFLHGKIGVEKNSQKAIEYFKLAHERGDTCLRIL